MAFGVTPEGWVSKRSEDIQSEIEEKARATLGANTNLDPRTPIGQFIGIIVGELTSLWEQGEQIYNSQSPGTAEGVPLDNVVSYTGTIRNQATKSTGTLTLFGDEGTLVPLGTVFSVDGNPDARFVSDVAATIEAGVDEVQRLTTSSIPSGGSFTLVFGTEVTAPILPSDTAGDIQTKLEGLANITAGDVVVTGAYPQFDFSFAANLGDQDVALLTVGSNTLEATETFDFDTVADSSGSLDRTAIILQDDVGSVAFWIDIDDSGSSIPADALAADRAVEVTTINTDDDANTVATKMAAAIDADSKFSSSASTNTVSSVCSTAGAKTDAADAASDSTGFSFTTTNQGADAGTMTLTVTEETKGQLPQVDVAISAETAGAVAGPSGSITVIETPVTGLDTVSNAEDVDIGSDLESDPDLKLRRIQELAIAGRATINAIVSRLSDAEGVTAVVVFQNNLTIDDSDGRPPKSLQIVVQGGDDAVVAAAIFDAIAGGMTMIGDESASVTDNQGFPQLVKWDRPTEVPVWVEVDLAIDPNFYPADGDAQVEAAILAFGAQITIGQDVIVHGSNSLECSFGEIAGITDITIRIGKTATPTLDDNIDIEANEIADFDSSRITVAQP